MFLCLARTQGLAALTSVSPISGTSGVGVTEPVVFTFDISMDDLQTAVTFIDLSNPLAGPIPVQISWNGPYTVLTCTPQPTWPGGKQITWVIDGETLDFEPVSEFGMFTTGSSGGGGSGTNAVTSFVIGKSHFYVQTSSAAPTLDVANTPYVFQAITSLASNRTASAVSVTAPTFTTYNLSSFTAPEFWQYADWDETSLTVFDNQYPAGTYVFNLTSSQGGGPTPVDLPVMSQPNPPRIENFSAAQTVDVMQPFTLTWDQFQGGTANDYINVSVGTNFTTPEFSQPNALKGTATSVVIPAGTLKAGETYSATIMFIRQVYQTNSVVATGAFRSTATDFPVGTKGLTLESPGVVGGKFGFEIGTFAGQTVTIESSSTLLPNSWSLLLETNAPGDRIRFVDPRALSGAMFYRVR